MAYAVKKTSTSGTYHLELSEKEADFLMAILARIAGTQNSPRRYQKSIRDAMMDAGAPYYMDTEARRLFKDDGRISFVDYIKAEDES